MAKKKKTIGDKLLESMAEALDHARGKKIAARVTRFRATAPARPHLSRALRT